MKYGQLDGWGTCFKYSMFVINLVTLLGGFILVAIGLWSLVSKFYANELLGSNLYAGAIIVTLITGLLVVLISLLGCIGSLREIRCLLVIYFIIVFLIFITMLIAGILGLVFREKVETTIENGMRSSLKSYGNDRAVTDAWDATQTELQCCGIYSIADWYPTIPESCCRYRTPGTRQNCSVVSQFDPTVTHSRGCKEATKRMVKDHALVIGISATAVACSMLFGMLCSCGLYRKIHSE